MKKVLIIALFAGSISFVACKKNAAQNEADTAAAAAMEPAATPAPAVDTAVVGADTAAVRQGEAGGSAGHAH